MKINQVRSALYAIAKLLGDINAIQKGKTKQRVQRRAAGYAAGKLMGKLFK